MMNPFPDSIQPYDPEGQLLTTLTRWEYSITKCEYGYDADKIKGDWQLWITFIEGKFYVELHHFGLEENCTAPDWQFHSEWPDVNFYKMLDLVKWFEEEPKDGPHVYS